jgi:hypothetical protein
LVYADRMHLHSLVLSVVLAAGIFACAPSGRAESARTTSSPPQIGCRAAPFRQFDFWVGDWDVYDADNAAARVARVRVSLILDDCVLLEEYTGADGHKGRSFSLYDASAKVWRQTWVTNRGEFLAIEGGLEPSGDMVLSGADRTAEGAARRVRGRWVPERGGVREIAARSLDDGASWKPWFDLEFRPHH